MIALKRFVRDKTPSGVPSPMTFHMGEWSKKGGFSNEKEVPKSIWVAAGNPSSASLLKMVFQFSGQRNDQQLWTTHWTCPFFVPSNFGANWLEPLVRSLFESIRPEKALLHNSPLSSTVLEPIDVILYLQWIAIMAPNLLATFPAMLVIEHLHHFYRVLTWSLWLWQPPGFRMLWAMFLTGLWPLQWFWGYLHSGLGHNAPKTKK